jgi:hypothetical protein
VPNTSTHLDITKELRSLYASRPRAIQKVLHLHSGILLSTNNAELTRLLTKLMYTYNHSHETPRAVFLGLIYTIRSSQKVFLGFLPWLSLWKTVRKTHQCYYTLHGADDHVTVPPHVVRSLSHQYLPLNLNRHFKALLVLQHIVNNRLSRQYSCNVTKTISKLSGPWADWYKQSTCGYQLTPPIVYLALNDEILWIDVPRTFVKINFQSRPPLSCSKQSPMELHRLTLRLRLQTPTGKIEVVNMDRFLPF